MIARCRIPPISVAGICALVLAGGCTPELVAGRVVSARVPPSGSLVIVRGVDGTGEGAELSGVEGAALVQGFSPVADARLSCEPRSRCGEIRAFDDGRFTVERAEPGPFKLHVDRAGLTPVEVRIESEDAYLLVLMPSRGGRS
jgi:hypothetical protein